MFETALKGLLARYLGRYVDVRGISAASLKASVWSGEVVLRDLALKAEALAWLELPVCVRAGTIGLLHMSIPWASLGTQPCKFMLEDVQLLATDDAGGGGGTAAEAAGDAGAAAGERGGAALARRCRATKRRKVEEALSALFRCRQRAGDDGTASTGRAAGLAERIAAKILDKLQVSVRRLHLRYEDYAGSARAAPGRAFAVGVTLGEASALSVDALGRVLGEAGQAGSSAGAADAAEPDGVVRKRGAVAALAVYWQPLDAGAGGAGAAAGAALGLGQPLAGLRRDELRDRMREMVALTPASACPDSSAPASSSSSTSSPPTPLGSCYVLCPTSFDCHAELREQAAVDASVVTAVATGSRKRSPRYVLHAAIPDLNLEMSHEQVCDAAALQSRAAGAALAARRHATRLRFARLGLRPRAAEGRGFDARAWWRYAGGCVLAALRRKRCSWQSFAQRALERRRYVTAFVRRSAAEADAGAEAGGDDGAGADAQLQALEDWLSVEELLMFRVVAARQLELEASRAQAQAAHRSAQRQAERQAMGWGQWGLSLAADIAGYGAGATTEPGASNSGFRGGGDGWEASERDRIFAAVGYSEAAATAATLLSDTPAGGGEAAGEPLLHLSIELREEWLEAGVMDALSRRREFTVDIVVGAPYVLLPLECSAAEGAAATVTRCPTPLLVVHLGHLAMRDAATAVTTAAAGGSTEADCLSDGESDRAYDYVLKLSALHIFTLRSCRDWLRFRDVEAKGQAALEIAAANKLKLRASALEPTFAMLFV
eukprot:g1960.t1